MLSEVDIANMALARVGGSAIAALSEQSEDARQVKLVYEQTVRAELSRAPWHFAKRQAALAETAAPPETRFARAFKLPEPHLKLLRINDIEAVTPAEYILGRDVAPSFELQGDTIHTDLPAPLRVVYVADVTNDPAQWHALFVDVVVAALAMRIAFAITKSTSEVAAATQMYTAAFTAARQQNAFETAPIRRPDSSWITERFRH